MKRKAKFLSVMLIMALLISLQPSSLSVLAADYVAPVSGLNVEKTAEPYGASDADGRQTFKLNISATTESNIVVTSKPCDIILVLDNSGSMGDVLDTSNVYTSITSSPTGSTYYVKVNGEYIQISLNSGRWRYRVSGTWYYVTWSASGDDNSPGNSNSSTPTAKPFYTRTTTTLTKLQALKNAANAFVTSVNENSPTSRIAVVSFNDSATRRTGSSIGTSLLTVSSGGTVNSAITNAINILNAGGGTQPQNGMAMAADIFHTYNNTADKERNRVVIMFTDGEPGGDITSTSGRTYAASTINQSAILKGALDVNISSHVTFHGQQPAQVTGLGCGATVYSIGVFDATVNAWTHEFMGLVSSDNKDTAPFEYYFTADSAESLNDIFQSIAQETGQTLENVSIIDYIDPRFNIVNASGDILDIGDSITIGSETGIIKQNANGIYIEWIKDKIEPGTLAEGKGFSGSFYIKPKSDFIGGNIIPTNIANLSAIYVGGQSIASLPNPTVNVPFKLNVSDLTDDIFLGEGILKSQEEAQNNMLYLNPNYSYPAGFVGYIWNTGFTTDVKPTSNSSYTLTATAYPYNFIDFSNTLIWTPLNSGSTLIGYTKSTGEIYYLPVGNTATQLSSSGAYNIRIRTGSLSITKNVNGTSNPNQTFVFEIKQYDDVAKTNLIRTFYETIRVEDNNNSRLVISLPKGYYEVKELADWSWQYDINSAQTVAVTLGMNANGTRNIGKTTASVSFENTSKPIEYLNSIDWVINRFSGDE